MIKPLIMLQDINIESKPLFDKYFSQYNHQISDFTFTNLFMWRKSYNIKYSIINDFLCIFAQYKNHDPFIFYPLGSGDLKPIVNELTDYFKKIGHRLIIKSLTTEMKDKLTANFPYKFLIKPVRDSFDYIYKSSDLINLKGKKFHSKRNHINKFKQSNNFEYRSLDNSLIDECIAYANLWYIKNHEKAGKSLEEEKNAIIDALNNFEALSFKGGVIMIEEKVEAFSYGEQFTPNMAVIHVEKANPEIQGAYTIINQQFCENEWRDIEFINREEDMGLEGLRKAKLSYKPAFMVEKYHATLID